MSTDNYGFYEKCGIFYVRFTDENGKRQSKSTGKKTKTAAKQKAWSWLLW